MIANDGDKSFRSHFGTISLKSSIFIRPAGVSPILMSIKTIGRVVDDILLGEGNLDVGDCIRGLTLHKHISGPRVATSKY